MGYLKRVNDRTYRIQYDVLPANGTRRLKRETVRDVTKREAAAILAQREVEILAKRRTLERGDEFKDEIMLDELFEGFMKAKRANKESTTLERYESLISLYLKPRLGSLRAGALKPFHLTNAYNDWTENGRDGRRVSGRTVRHVHELLRNILRWGVRREVLTRNVAASSRTTTCQRRQSQAPRPQRGRTSKAPRPSQEPTSRSKKRGYLCAQPWFYPAVAFAAYTGARRGEILA